MQQTPRITHRLIFYLALLPASFIAALIVVYSVNVPYEDQWMIAHFFERATIGTLSFRDLFEQQSDYRQFFPNLIIVVLGQWTYWDVRYEMALSLLLACLVSFNVYCLGRLTISGSETKRLLLFCFANLLIFSPIQNVNWFYGEQLNNTASAGSFRCGSNALPQATNSSPLLAIVSSPNVP
jgi:hypothetical protein